MTALQRLAVYYHLDPATAEIRLEKGRWRITGTPTREGVAPMQFLVAPDHYDTDRAATYALLSLLSRTLGIIERSERAATDARAARRIPAAEEHEGMARRALARAQVLLSEQP